MSGVTRNYGAGTPEQIEASFIAIRAELDRVGLEDVVITDTRRLYLKSPNGTFWKITVSDAGAISAAVAGVKPSA